MLPQDFTVNVTDEELVAIQRMIVDKESELRNELTVMKEKHQLDNDKLQQVIGKMMTDVRSMDAGMYIVL
jgi:hypothetical protein